MLKVNIELEYRLSSIVIRNRTVLKKEILYYGANYFKQ